ncbi:MAG TPA: response regulator [bacterium]|nr:response regulator [bacterium]HNS33711.1 response regulator [bacterium]HNW09208.1 response regulator [bacterium]HNZ73370.1 response regulator [bacterium]HOH67450.1 response regulator [bacterium]
MALKGRKILVADDERPMAKALELKFTKEGFTVKTVSNGREALDIMKKEKFDLLLLDLMMPRVDGFAVLAELKDRGDRTPVIVSSNLSQEEDIRRVKELGAKDYFVKSDTPISKVVDNVNKVLSG